MQIRRVLRRRLLRWLLVYCVIVTGYILYVTWCAARGEDEKGLGGAFEFFLTLPAVIPIRDLARIVHFPVRFSSVVAFLAMIVNCCLAYAVVTLFKIASRAIDKE